MLSVSASPTHRRDKNRRQDGTLNADGTSNLDAAMLQEIHDFMSKAYPETGVGTKTGKWRNIESERPELEVEEDDEITLASLHSSGQASQH